MRSRKGHGANGLRTDEEAVVRKTGSQVASREAEALRLDEADPLRRFRDLFCLPRRPAGGRAVYLCGNSLGLQPRSARAAVQRELDEWAEEAVGGHFDPRNPWLSYPDSLRGPLARLVGAGPDEVVVMNGLTANLHFLMAGFYRPTPDRFRILMEDAAFPSDTYAAASQVAFHGFDPAEGLLIARPREGEATLRTEDLEALLESRGHEIALVLLGGIHYYTGQFLDLARIAAAARARGCVVAYDLAHAAGNVPLELHDWGVDFAVWCSYKYLNGGPGAVAGAYVHERHHGDASIPRLAGWWGHDPDTRFRMHLEPEFRPREGAAGWQVSNPPVLALAPLRASLEIFEEAGLKALREKSIRLTGFLESLLDGIPGSRFEILTPRDPEARGCQLSLRFREEGRGVFRRLEDEGFVGDYREPGVVRAAPAPLYNTFHEVWRFSEALERILGEASPRPDDGGSDRAPT